MRADALHRFKDSISFQGDAVGELPLRLDDSLRPLISVLRIIESRLDEARAKSSAALSEILRGERSAGIEQLLDAEPALFEAQTLLQAAVVLGRTAEDLASTQTPRIDFDPGS